MTAPDRQPTLTGDRVILRPTTAADHDALFGVASDKLIWEVHPAHDRWKPDVFRAFFDVGMASGGNLTIIENATGEVMGASRFSGYRPERDEMEIGWTYIARKYWGGGYNREIKALMLNHLHRHVETAIFMVGEGNIRSRKAMEKIGGVLRPGAEMRTMVGVEVPHVTYEIRRA